MKNNPIFTLLPQELSGTKERSWVLEFPALKPRIVQESKKNKGKKRTTTLHHWLSLMGRSLCDWTHFL